MGRSDDEKEEIGCLQCVFQRVMFYEERKSPFVG